MTMTLVSTITVGSGGTTEIQFANVPQTGKDLLLVMSLRDTLGNDTAGIKLNNLDTNFTYRYLKNSGSGVTTAGGSNNYLDSFLTPSSFLSNTFSNANLYVTNYALAAFKPISYETIANQNNSTYLSELGTLLWSNTAAITDLRVYSFGSNGIAQYSTFSLYIIS